MDKEKFQKYMIFFAFFGSLYLYVQAFKILQTKVTAGISELAYIITLISGSAWLIYSFISNDPVIRVSAISGIIGSLLVLFLIFKFRDNDPEPKIVFPKNNRSPDDIITAYDDHREPNPWLFVMNDTCNIIETDRTEGCGENDP